jgi:hypothetical protein
MHRKFSQKKILFRNLDPTIISQTQKYLDYTLSKSQSYIVSHR